MNCIERETERPRKTVIYVLEYDKKVVRVLLAKLSYDMPRRMNRKIFPFLSLDTPAINILCYCQKRFTGTGI